VSSPTRRRTLVVANRTASTTRLLDEIERRAAAEPTDFVLLVPSARKGDWTLDEAVTALRRAARGGERRLTPHVEGIAGGEDPFEAVKAALAEQRYDDVLISTLSRRTSEWLRRDLPRRVEQLGVPVTVIMQRKPSRLSVDNTMIGGMS
jgi:hypothetical protein